MSSFVSTVGNIATPCAISRARCACPAAIIVTSWRAHDNATKKQSTARPYPDSGRNAQGQTGAAPSSVRAVPEAPPTALLFWSDLELAAGFLHDSQAPSDVPESAGFFVERAIDSISLNPDSVLNTLQRLESPQITPNETGCSW
jgi:hypothetical protein